LLQRSGVVRLIILGERLAGRECDRRQREYERCTDLLVHGIAPLMNAMTLLQLSRGCDKAMPYRCRGDDLLAGQIQKHLLLHCIRAVPSQDYERLDIAAETFQNFARDLEAGKRKSMLLRILEISGTVNLCSMTLKKQVAAAAHAVATLWRCVY